VKSASLNLDSDSERLTASFLQELLSKYSHSSDTQTEYPSHTGNSMSMEFPPGVAALRGKSSDQVATGGIQEEKAASHP